MSGVFGDLKFKISEGSDQTVSGVFEDLKFKKAQIKIEVGCLS